MGHRRCRPGSDRRHPPAPRPRAGRLLGALRQQARDGRRRDHRHRPDRRARATSSIDEILAMDADAVVYAPLIPNRDEVAAILRSGKNVVTPVGWFYPTREGRRSPGRRVRRGRQHPARHRHQPRRDHRAAPADVLGALVGGDVRPRRGVLRHPHLQRARRRTPHHDVRRQARGGDGRADARAALRRLHPVGADVRRRARLRRRAAGPHLPGGRRRDRTDRHARSA